VPVTQQNKHDYVKLYTKWLLNGSIDKQFKAFRDGFCRVVRSSMIHIFLPEELEQVICGSPVLDFKELEKAVVYEGYTPQSPIIRAFWELLHTYD
jgi:ubiquitin-protein ligase E3 A